MSRLRIWIIIIITGMIYCALKEWLIGGAPWSEVPSAAYWGGIALAIHWWES